MCKGPCFVIGVRTAAGKLCRDCASTTQPGGYYDPENSPRVDFGSSAWRSYVLFDCGNDTAWECVHCGEAPTIPAGF